jgi:hypothetical protein
MNRPSKTCSRAPGWHGPNGYVGCTGDTLAPPVRHAGAGAEPGGLAALAAHQAEDRAAGLEEEMDQVVVGGQRNAAVDAAAAVAVGAVDAGTDERAEDAVAVAAAAVAGQAAVVAENGVLGGGAAVGRSIEVVVAVLGGHHAQVGRKAAAVDEI